MYTNSNSSSSETDDLFFTNCVHFTIALASQYRLPDTFDRLRAIVYILLLKNGYSIILVIVIIFPSWPLNICRHMLSPTPNTNAKRMSDYRRYLPQAKTMTYAFVISTQIQQRRLS